MPERRKRSVKKLLDHKISFLHEHLFSTLTFVCKLYYILEVSYMKNECFSYKKKLFLNVFVWCGGSFCEEKIVLLKNCMPR